MAEGSRRVLGACPLDCPDTCSWVVAVEDGRAVRLQGDATHPFTRGALCNKVNGYVGYSRSPDRLLHPMRRRGPKGRGDFERISWDEALDEIAGRLSRIVREFGAEAIWPYVGSGSMGLLQGTKGRWPRFVKGGATVNATVDERDSDMGGGAVFHDNRVEVERLQEPTAAPRPPGSPLPTPPTAPAAG